MKMATRGGPEYLNQKKEEDMQMLHSQETGGDLQFPSLETVRDLQLLHNQLQGDP